MKNQERLFLAIGGVSPELVARSERRQRGHWLRYGFAAAACLALILATGRILPSWMTEPVTPPDNRGAPVVTVPGMPGSQGAEVGQLFLPEQGSEIGTLRLLSYTPESQDRAVDFLIYVNENQFTIHEESGVYSIRNTNPLPEGFPECGMDIFHLSGTSPSQAKSKAEAALKERYPEMSSEEPAVALPGSLYLRASERMDNDSEEGVFWDDEQAELWFVSDGQNGTFVLMSRYFLEAEEGLGARFRDMASSFRVVDLNEVVPDWMSELYTAANQLYPALFANDLSGVSTFMTEEAKADAYGENVWTDITIASVDYALDDDQNPTKATVSVKHRLNRVEGDSFSYLTMELACRNGNWYLIWSGIEK